MAKVVFTDRSYIICTMAFLPKDEAAIVVTGITEVSSGGLPETTIAETLILEFGNQSKSTKIGLHNVLALGDMYNNTNNSAPTTHAQRTYERPVTEPLPPNNQVMPKPTTPTYQQPPSFDDDLPF